MSRARPAWHPRELSQLRARAFLRWSDANSSQGWAELNPTRGTAVANSIQVGGLVGPILVAVLASESSLVQPWLYDDQIPPVVYLSGVLLFLAGLAVVRSHNVWARNWTVLVTLCGWCFLALGLVRMFAASQYLQATQGGSSIALLVLESCFLVVGLIITFKAYSGDTT